jgi:acyl homoserine lactone synthase
MKFSVLQFPRDVMSWHLVVDFMKLRAAVFVYDKGWNIPLTEGMDFEQYDVGFRATYVIAHIGPHVIGGARMLRCDNEVGEPALVSYMIHDATLGRISIPKNVCNAPPPTDADHWELTRLVTTDRRVTTVQGIMAAANEFLASQNAKACLFLGPPAFQRMAASFGYSPKPLGPTVSDEHGEFQAFSCDVIRRLAAKGKDTEGATSCPSLKGMAAVGKTRDSAVEWLASGARQRPLICFF